MKDNYQNKKITANDEKTKETTPGFTRMDDLAHDIGEPSEDIYLEDGMLKPREDGLIQYSFVADGFSTLAPNLDDALKQLDAYKKSKKN